MKSILTSLTLICLCLDVAQAKPASGTSKICLNSETGALTAKPKCKKGETALDLSELAANAPKGSTGVTGTTGPVGATGATGAAGVTGVANLNIVDSTTTATDIPGCTVDPILLLCLIPANISLTANCPADMLVLKTYCVTKNVLGTTPFSSAIELADGKGVTCTWGNLSTTPVTGTFFTRAVCTPLPPL